MAIFTKMWGSARGRVGGVVFSKGDNGLVYGRSYQPTVSNPKTKGQTDQRAKMNLVGQLSSVTPKQVLLGLSSGSNRIRRSEFTRHLLRVATLTTTNSTTIAKIAPSDVVFSKGAALVSARSAAAPVITTSNILIATELNDAAMAGRYGERIVVTLIDPTNKAGYSAMVYGDIIYDDSSVKNLTLNFPKPIVEDTMVCIYRLPFVLTQIGSATYQKMVNDGTNITAEFVNTPSMVKEWGDSINDTNMVFSQA